MNLWKRYELGRKGQVPSEKVAFHFEKGIEPELRELFLRFADWLRQKYCIPVSLNIYIKDCEKIRLVGGEMAYGGFRYFEDRPPYIRIPARIEPWLREEEEELDIYYSILGSLIHELTHYFQWVSELEQSDSASERQANYYRFRILKQFCKDNGMPY